MAAWNLAFTAGSAILAPRSVPSLSCRTFGLPSGGGGASFFFLAAGRVYSAVNSPSAPKGLHGSRGRTLTISQSFDCTKESVDRFPLSQAQPCLLVI